MGTAHAEIGTIQQAFNAGKTQGKTMKMIVEGKRVCT
jgi:filamentous hemagglutinin